MTEDERQNLLGTLAEAHVGLSEVAFKLRRELTPKTSVLKAVIKAERETLRLKRELQRLDIENPEQAKGRESLTAFVREPEGNGCIERFFKTLKEQLLWVRHLGYRPDCCKNIL